jgi:uncharacterized membrane protein
MSAELSSSDQRPVSVSADIAADTATDSSLSNPAEAQQVFVKCPYCGTALPEDAAFCPHCNWARTPVSLAERATAAAAYLPLVAPVILLLPAFRRNRFVRFHAWQSLSLWVVYLVLIGATVFFSSVASPMLVLLFGILVSFAMLFLWIVLTLKSWKGERFEVPLVGELAARMR